MYRRMWLACAVAIAIALTALPAVGGMTIKQSDLTAQKAPKGAIWVDSLGIPSTVTQDFGRPQAGRSVDGRPMTINGIVYAHGIGTHANSMMKIILDESAESFISMVGLDDEVKEEGSVVFEVWVDGNKAADSGIMRVGDEAKELRVDLTGAKEMELRVTDAGNGIGYDHADWAGAMIILKPGVKTQPRGVVVSHMFEPARIASVKPSPKPSINGPRIVGTTPGRPFIFLIPATGEGPLRYSAKNLPGDLILDPSTGIITGSVRDAGEYIVELKVEGPRGSATRELTIVAGEHKLALTPPMGWNSWNVWARDIDDAKVRAAADWMVKSGLAAHGYQYINIDDCWEGERNEKGEIVPNSKFPDMKALADYVHSKGLKLGIYSSPGPKTCAGFEGSWQHEHQDAKTYAKWGIDFLKHDWCSYRIVALNDSREELMKPYKIMRDALDRCGRDIVYSLCQYGMGNVWEWGAEVGGNLWRTTGDIHDSWNSMSSIGFGQAGTEQYAGPGHWNDPDMLVVGKVGWSANLRPSNLTPNEQVTHITLWSLLASPLLIGCDLSDMDQFTLDLLTNDEVIEVNQDMLGKQASRVWKDGELEVWARPLWDGTMAVGMFNRSIVNAEVTVNWADIGVTGPQPVRDLWLHKNVGTFNGSYTETVPAHGAILIKVGKPKQK